MLWGFIVRGLTWKGEWFRLVKQENYQKDFEGWGQNVSSLIKVSVVLKVLGYIR